MINTPATTEQETPVFFDAPDGTLFGVFARPTTDPVGAAIVTLPGGSTPVSTNRNRFSVRVCRGMAGHGFHSLRFDYHGAGESTGVIARLDLAHPFVEDLLAAVRWLEAQGISELVFVGSCFGGRTALACAPAVAATKGVVLISPPVRDLLSALERRSLVAAELLHKAMGDDASVAAARDWTAWTYLRRALRPRTIAGLLDAKHRRVYARYARKKWRALPERHHGERTPARAGVSDAVTPAGQNLLEPLSALTARGVPVLLVYGSTEEHYAEFLQAREQTMLGDVLDRAGPLVEIALLPGRVHGFPSLRVQEAAAEVVNDWVLRCAPGASPHGVEAVRT